jgi:pyrroloquinoline quinone biosynthesis protein E
MTQRRKGRTLHIWGDVPHWIVADAELTEALAALRTERELPDLAAELAARWNRPGAGVLKDLRGAVRGLYKAGVARRRGRAKKPPAPPARRLEVLCVNLTNRCNLRCTFCFNDTSRTDPRGEISADEILRFVKEARPLASRRPLVALMGGEPLLVKEKLLAVARATPRRWEKLVSTNGLLVDEAFARDAAAAGLEVQVSIDGARRASHERIRGRGTFEPACRAVRTLADAGVHTIMSMVAHRENQSEVAEYLDLALRLGADEARTIPLKRVGAGREVDLELPGFVRLLRDTVRAVRKRPERRRLLGRDYLSLLALTCAQGCRRTTCGTASQTILLDADGVIYPCQNHASSELAAGNIRERPFEEIFRGEMLSDLRRRYELSCRAPCRTCPVRHWCIGGCRGEAYNVTGRFDAPSATCRQNRRAMLETCWILSETPDLASGRQGHY